MATGKEFLVRKGLRVHHSNAIGTVSSLFQSHETGAYIEATGGATIQIKATDSNEAFLKFRNSSGAGMALRHAPSGNELAIQKIGEGNNVRAKFTTSGFTLNNTSNAAVFNVTAAGVVTTNGYTLPAAVTGANNRVLTAQTDGSTAWTAVTDTNTQLTLIDSDVMSGALSTNVASAESVKAYVDAQTHEANSNTWRTITAGGNTLGSLSEDLDFIAGTGISIAESGGNVTITNTVSDTDTNTWRTVTAGGNTLSTSETLAFTAGSNMTITESAGAVTLTSTDTNTQRTVGNGISLAGNVLWVDFGTGLTQNTGGATLDNEYVQDLVGAMVDGGTETNIAVTYDDTNGRLNFVSTDTNTVDMGDGFTVTATTSGTNTTVTEGDTLTIAAGSGVSTTATSDGVITIVNTSPDVNHNTDINVNVANLEARLPQIDTATTIGNGVTITAGGDLTVTGDLLVSGDTVTMNTATMAVEDPLISMASGNTADSLDVGFYAKYVSSGTKYAGLFRDSSDSDKWKLFATTGNSHAVPTTTVNTTSGFTLGTLVADTFEGALTGDVTGNADTSTKITSITNSNIVQLTDSQTLTNKTITGTFTGNLTGNADTVTDGVTVGTHAGNNNLAYFSSAGVISNTNNISITAVTGAADFYGSVEAGNVKIGTDTNKNTIETSSAQDLVLRTNGGTNSGTLTITDGANGAITIAPNGSGATAITKLTATNATLVTPALGTPSALVLTNATGAPIWNQTTTGSAGKITSITNSNIVQLTTAQTLTNKTLTSPTLTTPALGIPSALVLTNATGLVATTGLTATGTKSSSTFLRGDNTWVTPTDTDTVYTHPTTAGNKHIPTGGSSGQFLKYTSSGTAVWAADNDTNTNQLTTFLMHDGDGTEVTLAQGRQMKYVEGGGIDINWTDTDNGTNEDPFDLTFKIKDGGVDSDQIATGSVDLAHLSATGTASSSTYLRGDNSWATGGDVSKVGTPVNNQVGVWTGNGTIEGDAKLTWDGTEQLELTDSDAGSGWGPILSLYHDSASPLTNDGLGVIRFYGEDSAGNKDEYARIRAKIADANSGSEDVWLKFGTINAGTLDEDMLVLSAGGVSGTVIKDEDNLASDSATHLVTQQSIKAYVDASGGDTNAGGVNGSASAPTFSFTSDTDTGIYRTGANKIGFALNGARQFEMREDIFYMSGNGATQVIRCDDASAHLELRSGGSTHGKINIGKENQDITITPAGSGDLVLDGLSWPNADGTANYVLKTDGSAQLSWTEMSSGTTGYTWTSTSGSEQFLISDTSDTALVKIVQLGTGNAFEVHDQASDSTFFSIDQSGNTTIGSNASYGNRMQVHGDVGFTTTNFYIGGSSGKFMALSGTAASPYYTFNGDTNTGMYRGGTDILGFSTAGTERMTISAAGAIRINDSYDLPVAKTGTNDYVLTGQTDGSTAWAAVSGGGGDEWGDVVDAHIIPDGDSTRDIGSSSVEFRHGYFDGTVYCDGLDLGGNIVAPNRSLQITAGGSQSSRAHIFFPNNETYLRIYGSSSSNTDIVLDTRYTSGTGEIQLKTKGSTRFAIGAAGELLIGGSAAGTSGQILTSGGAAPPTWADASGITATSTDTLTNKTYGPLSSGYVVMGATNDTLAITSNGAHNLSLTTNSFTNSGQILMQQGANNPISIAPHGTGDVKLIATTTIIGTGSGLAYLKSSGNHGLLIKTGHPSTGSIHLLDGADERIIIAPHGVGYVRVDGSGVRVLPDGTAALPAYTWNNDSNTGIYQPAADKIGFTVGGAEAVRIEGASLVISKTYGRLDFNTTSPNNHAIYFRNNNNYRGEIHYNHSSNYMAFKTGTGSDEGLRIDSSGNVELKRSNTELRFYEGSNYVGFEAPALTANQIWVLPTADGDADQVLKTDGSGALGWATAGGGGGIDGSGTANQIPYWSDSDTLTNSKIKHTSTGADIESGGGATLTIKATDGNESFLLFKNSSGAGMALMHETNGNELGIMKQGEGGAKRYKFTTSALTLHPSNATIKTDASNADINITPHGSGSVRINDTGTNTGSLRVGTSSNSSYNIAELVVTKQTAETSQLCTGIRIVAAKTGSSLRANNFGAMLVFAHGEDEYNGFNAGEIYTRQIGVTNANFNLHLDAQGTGQVVINDEYKLPAAVTGTNDYVLTAQTDGTTAWASPTVAYNDYASFTFQRDDLGTQAVDMRIVGANASDSNNGGYPIPAAGVVKAISISSIGLSIDASSAAQTFRVRRNGASSTGGDAKDFTFTRNDMTNSTGTSYCYTKTGSDVEQVVAAGDVIQIKRQAGSLTFGHIMAIVYIDFS